MDRWARIFIASHRGIVGSALLRRLRGGGYENLLLRSPVVFDCDKWDGTPRKLLDTVLGWGARTSLPEGIARAYAAFAPPAAHA